MIVNDASELFGCSEYCLSLIVRVTDHTIEKIAFLVSRRIFGSRTDANCSKSFQSASLCPVVS